MNRDTATATDTPKPTDTVPGPTDQPTTAPAVEPQRSLTLRAHVDFSGDGEVAPGDLVTTASIPVPASGDHGPVEVLLEQV